VSTSVLFHARASSRVPQRERPVASARHDVLAGVRETRREDRAVAVRARERRHAFQRERRHSVAQRRLKTTTDEKFQFDSSHLVGRIASVARAGFVNK
jgi:hypothetical protein